MKNLLDRAKPELKQAMESFKTIYPNTINSLENSMKENRLVSDLTYDSMLNIRMVLRDCDLPFDMMNPWAYFEDDK